ncbi:MAG: hypothetical protein JNL58_24495 [Planctomyces sp.]|nr:hypothetical protein [Planctomyces sp.]
MWVAAALFPAIVSSGSAAASCGDYLFRNGKPVAGHSTSEGHWLKNSWGSFELLESPVTPVDVPVRRCSGPNCSGNPLPLLPVPSGPTNQLRDNDADLLLEMLSLRINSGRSVELPESERGARYLPSTIFRPPAS